MTGRRRRWLLVLAVGACLGVVAIVVALRNAASWVEANRERIAAQAAGALGRPVTFGEIGLKFFPALAVRVADVRLGDDPAWSDQPFVAADAAEVVVSILPALLRRIVVRRVRLDAPTVTLIRDGARLNVDSLGGGGDRDRPDEAPARPARDGSEGPASGPAGALPFALGAVSVVDGHLRLIERRDHGETVIEASDVDVELSGGDLAEAVRLDVRAALFGAARQNAVVTGRVGPLDLADPGAMPLDVEVRMDAVDTGRARAVREVAATLPAPLALDGPIDARATVTGRLAAPAFDGQVDATSTQLGWAEWFRKPAGVTLRLAAAGRRAGMGAALERFELRLAEVVARGRGDASPERLALHVDAAPSSAGALVALLPALNGWDVRGEVGLQVDVTGRVDQGRLPSVTGDVTMRDLAVTADDSGLEITNLTQTIAVRDDVAEVPSTSLRVNGVPVTIAARVENVTSSVVRVRDLDVQTFDGRITGTIVADRSEPARPAFSSDLEWAALDVAALTALASPSSKGRLSGRLSGRSELRGEGLGGPEARRTLQGAGQAAVADGTLTGVNLGSSVLAVLTRLPGFGTALPKDVRAEYPGIFGTEDTHFQEMTSRWRVADGVIHLDRIAIKAEDFSVDGRGTLDRANRLDATGTLQASRNLSRRLVGVADVVRYVLDPAGVLAIPFSVRGVWPDVRVTPDATGLARTLPGQVIEGGLRELLGEDDSDGSSGSKKGLIQRGLEGLFRP